LFAEQVLRKECEGQLQRIENIYQFRESSDPSIVLWVNGRIESNNCRLVVDRTITNRLELFN